MAAKTQKKLAYRELHRRILIQEVMPNERLREKEWAEKLQVSRAAIREALTQLVGEGLARPGEKGGYFVTQMGEDDIHEIRQLREVFETAAFRLACDRITEKELNAIDETCRDFAGLVKKGYYSGACECDLRFHNLLLAASGNKLLVKAYERSNIPLFHMKLGHSLIHMDDYAETEHEHRMIAEALRRRDKKGGIRLLQLHFRRGEQSALGKNGESPAPINFPLRTLRSLASLNM